MKCFLKRHNTIGVYLYCQLRNNTSYKLRNVRKRRYYEKEKSKLFYMGQFVKKIFGIFETYLSLSISLCGPRYLLTLIDDF